MALAIEQGAHAKARATAFTYALSDGPDREEVKVEIFPGISMDPGVRFGKPCIAGTRVDVATVVADMGAGESLEAVQEAYQLTREQVLAALRYAAHLAAHTAPAVSEAS